MALSTPQTSMLINYPHMPGFTLLSYQVKQDLEHCFPLTVQAEATDEHEFALQLEGIPVFHKKVQTISDIDRQQIYDAVTALFEPVAELPPQPKHDKIEEEWLHCHCSGE